MASESKRVLNAAKSTNMATAPGSSTVRTSLSHERRSRLDEDTRVFAEPRLSSLQGYKMLPHVIDGLDIPLPASTMYTGRLVRVGSKVWEVWSPNSKRSPFYPGKAVNSYVYGKTGRPGEKRVDGHLGRFDHTVSPQVAGPPWWSLISRQVRRKKSGTKLPEFDAVHARWINEPGAGRDKGRLGEEFVSQLIERNGWADEAINEKAGLTKVNENAWVERPLYPTRASLIRLEGTISYGLAVDLVTEAQRGIKEKVAWLDWAERYSRRPRAKEGAETHLVLPADDRYMGRWVNGLDGALLLWLLEERIPCFVIHALTDDEMLSFMHSDTIFLPGFLTRSEAEDLAEENNEYEVIAKRNQCVAQGTETPSYIDEQAPVSVEREQAARTFSRNSGWVGAPGVNVEEYILPEVEESFQSYTPPLPLPSIFELSPPEVREIYPDRVPWIVPPTLRLTDADEKGWSKWESEIDDDGRDCVSLRGKRFDLDGTVYYDRSLKRQIAMDPPEMVPGVVNEIDFGFPGPNIQYRSRTSNGWRDEKRSDWLYFRKYPNPSIPSREPPVPKEEQLPLRNREVVAVPACPSTPTEEHGHDENPRASPVPSVRMQSPEARTPPPTNSRPSTPTVMQDSRPPALDQCPSSEAVPNHRPVHPEDSSPRPDVEMKSPGQKTLVVVAVVPPPPSLTLPIRPISPLEQLAPMGKSAETTFTGRNASVMWTPYLKIEGLPVGIDWEDFYAASGLAALFNGSVKAKRMLQSVEKDYSVIWLQLASEADALQTQGFLVGRAYNDDTMPDCTLITEEEFKSTCLVAVRMEILDQQSAQKETVTSRKARRSASPVRVQDGPSTLRRRSRATELQRQSPRRMEVSPPESRYSRPRSRSRRRRSSTPPLPERIRSPSPKRRYSPYGHYLRSRPLSSRYRSPSPSPSNRSLSQRLCSPSHPPSLAARLELPLSDRISVEHDHRFAPQPMTTRALEEGQRFPRGRRSGQRHRLPEQIPGPAFNPQYGKYNRLPKRSVTTENA